MATFLTTNETSSRIEEIIRESKCNLVLISPYWQLSKNLIDRIHDASNRDVSIVVIFGKDTKPSALNAIADLKNIKIYHSENLHAKCYFNDNKMIITSMNMYSFSEKNNQEMGIFIEKETDKDLYEKAYGEAKFFKNRSTEVLFAHTIKASIPAIKDKGKLARMKYSKTEKGYCIRCKEPIPYNPSKPYCPDCHDTWATYKNENYIEQVCHCCGVEGNTRKKAPECYSCYIVQQPAMKERRK